MAVCTLKMVTGSLVAPEGWLSYCDNANMTHPNTRSIVLILRFINKYNGEWPGSKPFIITH